MRRLTLALALALVLAVAACAKASPTSSSTSASTTSASKPTTSATSPTTPATSKTTAPASTASTAAPKPTTVSAADFYKSNIVNLTTAYDVGGAGDFATRVFASLWPDKVGGAMVVKNMPGGGSLVATNFVYQAKPDGLTVGTANLGSGVISPVIMGDAGAKYDLKKMNWIGAYLSGGSLVVTLSTAKPYKTVKDLQAAKGLKFASRSPTAASTTYAALFFEVFGIDAKIVTGYQGGADMALAAKRGEVDGTVMPASGLPVYIDAGGLQKPVMNMDFARSEYFPDTPSLAESAKLTPQQESLLRLQNATGASDKAVFAPPGIAEDRVKLMRDAFDKIIGDKGFKTLNEKYFPIWTRPMSGAELTEYIDKTLAIPKSELDAMSALSKKYLAVK